MCKFTVHGPKCYTLGPWSELLTTIGGFRGGGGAIRSWPYPKPLKGPTCLLSLSKVLNVIMNGRVIKIFRAVLTVWWFQKVKFCACSAAISTSITSIMWLKGKTHLNTRTAGGGDKKCPPLRFFADSGKTAACSATIFSVAAHNWIWHLV